MVMQEGSWLWDQRDCCGLTGMHGYAGGVMVMGSERLLWPDRDAGVHRLKRDEGLWRILMIRPPLT